jgi:hypothetical protein
MAFLDVEFSAEEIKAAGLNLITAGNYIAQIVKSEIKVNKDGFGSRLSLQFQITDGENRGRILFHDVTLKNQSETAMKIGREQLAQLARACGLTRVQDSAQLHGIEMQIKVSIREDKTGQYDPRNAIKRFEPLPGQVASPAAPATPAVPPAAPAGRAMPWKRGAEA